MRDAAKLAVLYGVALVVLVLLCRAPDRPSPDAGTETSHCAAPDAASPASVGIGAALSVQQPEQPSAVGDERLSAHHRLHGKHHYLRELIGGDQPTKTGKGC